MSNLEKQVFNILKSAHVKFVQEKIFSDLTRARYRFDFYLPTQNILIEVDGLQHIKQIPKFQKTRQEFLKTQESDRAKNSYALSHSIPLYRIPEWEIKNLKTIEDIFQSKYLVTSKFHNDYIREEYFKKLNK